MQNSQKQMEKEAKQRARAKSYKAHRSWRLLVVGDHGRIIPFGRIKGLIISLIATLIVSFAAACVLGFLYLRQKHGVDLLKDQLSAAQKQSAGLRDERDVLMTRLVIAESNLKPKTIPAPESLPAKASPEQNPPAAPPAAQAVKTVEKPAEQLAQSRAPESQPAKPEGVASESPASTPWSIAMENFQLSHDVKRNRLTARFKIKNTTPGSVRLSGKCVLVLRGSHGGSPQVMALPNVPLADGKPSGSEGQNFRIWRFFDLTLRSQNLPDRFSFDRGTLYVFGDKGDLIAKQEVPVSLSYAKELRAPAVVSPEGPGKPAEASVPAETRPAAIVPPEAGSGGQASDQTPPQPAAIEKPEPAQETPGEPNASESNAPGQAPER